MHGMYPIPKTCNPQFSYFKMYCRFSSKISMKWTPVWLNSWKIALPPGRSPLSVNVFFYNLFLQFPCWGCSLHCGNQSLCLACWTGSVAVTLSRHVPGWRLRSEECSLKNLNQKHPQNRDLLVHSNFVISEKFILFKLAMLGSFGWQRHFCKIIIRRSGVNMITDVLYSVNMYILFLCKALWAKSCYGHFCVKRFELSHVMDIFV